MNSLIKLKINSNILFKYKLMLLINTKKHLIMCYRVHKEIITVIQMVIEITMDYVII